MATRRRLPLIRHTELNVIDEVALREYSGCIWRTRPVAPDSGVQYDMEACKFVVDVTGTIQRTGLESSDHPGPSRFISSALTKVDWNLGANVIRCEIE